MAETVQIASPHVRAEVRAEAAIVRLAEFRLGDRWIAPFADAPWAGDPAVAAGHMRWLGGEFFCLPFGGDAYPDAAGGWASTAGDTPLHGRAATNGWTITKAASDRVTLELAYPLGHAVERIERTVICASDTPVLDIAVSIHARRAARVPAAFHPILRLPERAGALRLDARFASARTHPDTRGPWLAPDRAFDSLARAPGRNGTVVDLSALPPGPAGEAVAQLLRVEGPITTAFVDESFALTLDWDRAALPHALVWVHDRAIDTPPWNGAFRGVGIEPCASAFDLPWAVSAGDNPLALAGETTALALDPTRPTDLWLRLHVSDLPEGTAA